MTKSTTGILKMTTSITLGSQNDKITRNALPTEPISHLTTSSNSTKTQNSLLAANYYYVTPALLKKKEEKKHTSDHAESGNIPKQRALVLYFYLATNLKGWFRSLNVIKEEKKKIKAFSNRSKSDTRQRQNSQQNQNLFTLFSRYFFISNIQINLFSHQPPFRPDRRQIEMYHRRK